MNVPQASAATISPLGRRRRRHERGSELHRLAVCRAALETPVGLQNREHLPLDPANGTGMAKPCPRTISVRVEADCGILGSVGADRETNPPSSVRSDAEAPGHLTRPTVQILLATYNSELYLEAQLASVFGQTFDDFVILVADDGSADGTLAILLDYARRFPGRLELLPGREQRGGPLSAFARLLDASNADYIFFCDHDDVWLPDKIALTLAEMKRAEREHGAEMPILVHTDLAVVGSNLELIHPSAAAYAKLSPASDRVPALLLGNAVCGCASAANRALCRRALPIPSDAMMHDHWLALVAAAFGVLRYIPEATILYRQHERNVIGLQPWQPSAIAMRVWQTIFGTRKLAAMAAQCRQAAALANRFGDLLSPVDRRAASALSNLWNLSRLQRIGAIRSNGLALSGTLRTLALYYLVLSTAEAGAAPSDVGPLVSPPDVRF